MPVDLAAVLADVPAWRDRPLTITPLGGGITNRNFIATVDGARFVVRVPGERTELLGIDRANEREATLRAAALGISPSVVGVVDEFGTLITEFHDGAHREGARFVAALDDVVGLLRRFHSSGPLTAAFPIHRIVERHAADALDHGVRPPAIVERLLEQSARIEAACAVHPTPPVPSHNDLLPGNVLFGADGRVWLLDFEYAGMNDCCFDLANLSVNCGLDEAADRRMLESYFGAATAVHHARLALMKVMSELREGMWAVVQQAISTLDTDFVAYADERLGRSADLAFAPSFDGWLAAVADAV